jgi:hypothetical protein
MTIENRVAKLEWKLLVWRWITIALGIVLGVFIYYSQTAKDVTPESTGKRAYTAVQKDAGRELVRTKKLEIINDKGEKIAGIESLADDNAILYLDSNKGDACSISVGKYGTHFNMNSGKGSEYVSITAATMNNFGILSVEGDHCKTNIFKDSVQVIPTDFQRKHKYAELASKLKSNTATAEDIRLLDEASQENPAVTIRATDMGSGILEIYHPLGQGTSKKTPLVSIGTTESVGGIVNVCNLLGKIVISAQADKTNKGLLYVTDVNGDVKKFLA